MKMIFASILFALTISNCQNCDAYRILGLFGLPAKSHFIMFEALMKGLARKGHQVDVISTFPLRKPYPNYTDIIDLPLTFPSLVNSLTYDHFIHMEDNIIEFLSTTAGNGVCENLGHPKILQLCRNPPKDPPYDIMITEFFTTNCYMAVGNHLKIPTVGVSSANLYPWLNEIIANPPNFAFVPNNFLDYAPPMNFWQRFWNTVYSGFNVVYFRYLTQEQDKRVKKYFGDNVPSLAEIERNISLVLVNTHISLNGGRPTTSALVEVAGLHIRLEDNELPKDLKAWMDSSEEGFIYFSFGSMVTIESFPTKILQAVFKSLEKLAPMRVLVKIADPKKLPPGLPTNVRTSKWAPQLHVLCHKNIKAFITHGGLMGTQESVYCGVPMIGIPLFIDQFTNVDLYVSKKIAVKINHQEITEEKLDKALNEVLHNPIYKKNVVATGERFRDRPMSPLDTAIWWIEFVVRRGDQTLKSPAINLTWWQIGLLDVYLFLLLLVVMTTFFLLLLLRFIARLLITITKSKINTVKKND